MYHYCPGNLHKLTTGYRGHFIQPFPFQSLKSMVKVRFYSKFTTKSFLYNFYVCS